MSRLTFNLATLVGAENPSALVAGRNFPVETQGMPFLRVWALVSSVISLSMVAQSASPWKFRFCLDPVEPIGH